MREIGVNTFGLSALIGQDFTGTFEEIRKIGFDSVEPLIVFSGAMGMDPDALAAGLSQGGQHAFWVDRQASGHMDQLRKMGLAVHGAHLGLVGILPDGLKTALPFLGPFAKENGLEYYVHSPQKETILAVQADAQAFRQAIEELKEYGVEMLFHCHYNEFRDDHGETVFSYLLREIPELRVELDVGWVQYAGVDVVQLMHQYADRIAIIHFKDFADGDQEKDFCAIGEGKLPLKEIMNAARELGLNGSGYVIDQDASSGDMLADLRTGYQNILRWEEKR